MPRRARVPIACLAALAAAASLGGSGGPAAKRGLPLPASRLEVLQGTRWVSWWESAGAPAAWHSADEAVAASVAWHPGATGLEWGELEIGGTDEAWRLRVVLVRFSPRRLRLELVRADREGGTLADWSLDELPPGAGLGLNAGQFTGGQPWGWIVRNGIVEQPTGAGALSMAFIVLGDGATRLIPVEEIPPAGPGPARDAFQSYPALLVGDGRVPPQLAAGGLGVDVEHRDARLALGELRDGRCLVALTRFDAAGQALGSLPFGPTVPETAAILGALGCSRAVMLDGGISGQLAVRDANGDLRRWRGWRKVPLALVGYPRQGVPRDAGLRPRGR